MLARLQLMVASTDMYCSFRAVTPSDREAGTVGRFMIEATSFFYFNEIAAW